MPTNKAIVNGHTPSKKNGKRRIQKEPGLPSLSICYLIQGYLTVNLSSLKSDKGSEGLDHLIYLPYQLELEACTPMWLTHCGRGYQRARVSLVGTLVAHVVSNICSAFWSNLPEERFIRGDIQVATGCTMAVPLPRSPPLTRQPTSPPKLVPPVPNAIFGRLQ